MPSNFAVAASVSSVDTTQD